MLGQQQERRVTYVLSLRMEIGITLLKVLIDHKCYRYTKKHTQKNVPIAYIYTAAKSRVGLGGTFSMNVN